MKFPDITVLVPSRLFNRITVEVEGSGLKCIEVDHKSLVYFNSIVISRLQFIFGSFFIIIIIKNK